MLIQVVSEISSAISVLVFCDFILGFSPLFLFQCYIFSFVESVKKRFWIRKIIKVAENKQNRKAEEQGGSREARKEWIKNRKLLLCYLRVKGIFLCCKEVQNIKGKRSRRRTNSRSTLNRGSKSFCLSIAPFHWSFTSTHKEAVSNNFF